MTTRIQHYVWSRTLEKYCQHYSGTFSILPNTVEWDLSSAQPLWQYEYECLEKHAIGPVLSISVTLPTLYWVEGGPAAYSAIMAAWMLSETWPWSRTFYLCDIANTILSGDLGPTQPLFQYECLEKHATDSVLFNLCDIANTILRGGGPGTYSAVSFRQGNLPFSWGNGQAV